MLWRLRQAFSRFMYGRNGFDRLTLWLLVIYITLGITRGTLRLVLRNEYVDLGFWIVMTLLFCYCVFRVVSRNTYARRNEEAKFLSWWRRVINLFKVMHSNRVDKSRKYMICPHCRAIIRFPRKKGVHSASCPKCRGPLTVRI